ncbi:hypothetical protein ScalyP_jg10192 [Parmales sp. scaly parma]|nr:hypothetical protein ScalyP_jg10192 [Parmales sp. scaly parma]
MAEIWNEMDYHPVVWKYTKKDGSVGECPIGCGNDLEDIFLISSCYLSLWSFLMAFYAILLKGALDTDNTSTILFEYLVAGIFFCFLVGGSVVTGQWEVQALHDKKKKMGIADDEEIPDDDDE